MKNIHCFLLPKLLLLQVDGYARLFGIFKEVRMLVTSDSLQMYLTTEVNKSFKINVHVTTNYSSDRNETQFNATVVFDNGLSKVRSHTLSSISLVTLLINRKAGSEPNTRNVQPPHIPVTAFSQTDLFLV